MKRNPGFTLIELIAVISVMAVLVTSFTAGASYQIASWQYAQEAQNTINLLDQARINSIAQKKCNNGEPSSKWQFVVKKTKTGQKKENSTHLQCIYISAHNEEETLEEAQIKHQQITPKIYTKNTSGEFNNEKKFTSPPIAETETIETIISFSEGGLKTNIKIGTHTEEDIKVTFFSPNDRHRQTICMNRRQGFFTLNQDGKECAQDKIIVTSTTATP